MSRAVKLAKKCGICTKYLGQDMSLLSDTDIDDFYHAARAEMANEAADELKKVEPNQTSYAYKMLRAMADREGK